MTIVARSTYEDDAAGANYLWTFGTLLRDDETTDLLYQDNTIYGGPGWFRVTGLLVSQDSDIPTTAIVDLAVITQVQAGNPTPPIITHRVRNRDVAGTGAVKRCISGLVYVDGNANIGLLLECTDSTARDWEVEIQVEAA